MGKTFVKKEVADDESADLESVQDILEVAPHDDELTPTDVELAAVPEARR